MAGKAQWKEQKAGWPNHISIHKAEGKHELGLGYVASKLVPCDSFSFFSKVLSPKDSTSFPGSIASWGLSVRTCDPMGTSHLQVTTEYIF